MHSFTGYPPPQQRNTTIVAIRSPRRISKEFVKKLVSNSLIVHCFMLQQCTAAKIHQVNIVRNFVVTIRLFGVLLSNVSKTTNFIVFSYDFIMYWVGVGGRGVMYQIYSIHKYTRQKQFSSLPHPILAQLFNLL